MMKQQKQAQNSIDYMVLHKPHVARKILKDYGYEPLKKVEDLAKATKQLIVKKGKPVIKELLQHHPDKQAIISVSKPKCSSCQNKIDTNTCTSCTKSNENSLRDHLSDLPYANMSMAELQRNYEIALQDMNKNPTDRIHALKVQTIASQINSRSKDKKKRKLDTEEVMVIIGVFVLGFICGKLSYLKA